jgi:hypothetical protein
MPPGYVAGEVEHGVHVCRVRLEIRRVGCGVVVIVVVVLVMAVVIVVDHGVC